MGNRDHGPAGQRGGILSHEFISYDPSGLLLASSELPGLRPYVLMRSPKGDRQAAADILRDLLVTVGLRPAEPVVQMECIKLRKYLRLPCQFRENGDKAYRIGPAR